MIRSKPPGNEYRDGWGRIFGDGTTDDGPAIRRTLHRVSGHTAGCRAFATVQGGECDCQPDNNWPTAHEDDCPFMCGGECRCPMGNL